MQISFIDLHQEWEFGFRIPIFPWKSHGNGNGFGVLWNRTGKCHMEMEGN